MKKIVTYFTDREVIKHFKEEVKWTCLSWSRPKESGEYIVSNGDGTIYKLNYAQNEICVELFDQAVRGGFENVMFSDTREKLSSEDLIALYRHYNIWYCVNDAEGDDYYPSLVIYRGKDIPKYFLKMELIGPIDREIDNYETIIDNEKVKQEEA